MPRKTPQKQPALAILRGQARTIRGVARIIGIPEHQLRNAVHGHYRPTPQIREHLPVILGQPLGVLFTADMLTPSPVTEQRQRRSLERVPWVPP